MANECDLKYLTKNWLRWWSIRPLFKSSLLLRRLIGDEDARINAVNLLELNSGQRVLELGCGLGANLCNLHATGAQIIAVDESPENVAASRNEVRANNLMNIKVMSLDEAEKSLEAESFDAILCCNTFTSTDRQDLLLHLACKWLKKGGKIAVVDYVPIGETHPEVIPIAAPIYW